MLLLLTLFTGPFEKEFHILIYGIYVHACYVKLDLEKLH